MSKSVVRSIVVLIVAALTVALLTQLTAQEQAARGRASAHAPAALDSSVLARFRRIAMLERPANLGHGVRLVVIGDSLGANLARGLARVAPARQASVVQDTVSGCSTIEGLPLLADGSIIPWAPDCLDYLRTWHAKVAATPANAVVWLSGFDGAERLIEGVPADPATPEGRLRIAELIIETANVVASPGTGRQIVFVLPAPNAPSALHGPPDPQSAIDVKHHRAILHLVVASDPSRFSMLRLDRFLCPRGAPCPAEPVPGIAPRSADGGHLTPEGAAWLAPQVLDALGVT